MVNPFKSNEIEYNYFNIEMNLLYTLFMNPTLFDDDFVLNPDNFFHEETKMIAKYLNYCHDFGNPISHDGLFEFMSKNKIIINIERVTGLFQDRILIESSKIYKTIKIIIDNKRRIDMKHFGIDLADMAGKISSKTDDVLLLAERFFNKVYTELEPDGNSLESVVNDVIKSTNDIHISGNDFFIRTGIKELDDKLGLTLNSIILIGGAAKQGKTKFLTYLTNLLLERYSETLSIYWNNFEDDDAKMVRAFLSPKLLMSYDDLCGKTKKLTQDEIINVKTEALCFAKHDIIFNSAPSTIAKVSKNFKSFIKKRPGKMHILVIDNYMLLAQNETSFKNDTQRDDYVMAQISILRQTTGALIILLHHFNDDQQNKDNLSIAYKPILKHLKGSEAFRRIAVTTILINYPKKYADLMALYKGYEHILQYMYIIDFAASRNSGTTIIDEHSDNQDLLYYFASLEYNFFKLIKHI